LKGFVFLAPGFEEAEAVILIDLLRRAEMDIVLVGVGADSADADCIKSARGLSLKTEMALADTKTSREDLLLLPGGQPGTSHLITSELLKKILIDHHAQGGAIAAICAAPSILDHLGFLKNKSATCHPSVVGKMTSTQHLTQDPVVMDGNLLTSRGLGTAFEFGFCLIERFCGIAKREAIEKAITYERGGL
jgi:4-methyl-5(b-hydroxyethyl)-thiazole monophosphate biosynthesis